MTLFFFYLFASLFLGIENCLLAKSYRRDGQGKSNRQINKVYYRHEGQHAQRSATVLRDGRISVQCVRLYVITDRI